MSTNLFSIPMTVEIVEDSSQLPNGNYVENHGNQIAPQYFGYFKKESRVADLAAQFNDILQAKRQHLNHVSRNRTYALQIDRIEWKGGPVDDSRHLEGNSVYIAKCSSSESSCCVVL